MEIDADIWIYLLAGAALLIFIAVVVWSVRDKKKDEDLLKKLKK